MINGPIMKSMNSTKSKVFQNLSQSTANIKNFEGGSVDCPKITEDMSSESRIQTPSARLIIATSTVPRCRAWKLHLSITAVLRRRAWKPRLKHHCGIKT